jgi:O-antigen/teichoic acid export membrane protein
LTLLAAAGSDTLHPVETLASASTSAQPVSIGMPAGSNASTPAPTGGWHRLAHDWLLVGGATVISHAVGICTSLLFRSLLDPVALGIWQGLKLLLSFGDYLNLGANSSATRELTVALGRGDSAAAEHGLNHAFTVNLLSSLLYALGLLVASACWWLSPNPLAGSWSLGLALLSLMLIVQRQIMFQVGILRAEQKFAVTSRLLVIEGLLTLSVAGACTWAWGLAGMYYGTLAVLVVMLVYVESQAGRRFRFSRDGRAVGRLIGLGSPILLAGLVTMLFRSLDRLMILGFSPEPEFQLGCYSLGLLVGTQIVGIAEMLTIVISPRYGELFGAAGCRRSVAELAARVSECHAALLALVGGLSLVVARPLLARMFPSYQPGLAPMVWIVPGAIALGLSLPASQYMIALYHERRALAASGLATMLAAIGIYWTLRHGGGLPGVALVTSLSYTLNYGMVLRVSIWPELTASLRMRYVASHLLTIMPTLLLAWYLESPGMDSVSGSSDSLLGVLAKAAAVSLVWMATVLVGWHWGDWGTVWRRGSTEAFASPKVRLSVVTKSPG